MRPPAPFATSTAKPPSGIGAIAEGAPSSWSAAGTLSPTNVSFDPAPSAPRTANQSFLFRSNAAAMPPATDMIGRYEASTTVVASGETRSV